MTTIPPPGVHGGDGAAIARALGVHPDDMIDLSTTLNPLAPDPAPILSRHLDAVRRYPDPTVATEALADTIGVPVERIVLTNGGAEAISLIGAILGGRVVEPDFARYPRGPAVSPVAGLTPAEPPRWRSNPRSPLGELAPARADDRSEPTVWDEAFWPLATGTWSRRDDRHGDVIVGSLTKLLACPGLRAGYLIVPDDDFGERLLAEVATRRSGWSVSGLVCEALPDLLRSVDLAAWCEELDQLRGFWIDTFAALGFEVVGTGPTWLLIRGARFRDGLARERVVVRDCASFGLRDTIRFGLPRPDDRDIVLHAFTSLRSD